VSKAFMRGAVPVPKPHRRADVALRIAKTVQVRRVSAVSALARRLNGRLRAGGIPAWAEG
jgi:hypothetical protein